MNAANTRTVRRRFDFPGGILQKLIRVRFSMLLSRCHRVRLLAAPLFAIAAAGSGFTTTQAFCTEITPPHQSADRTGTLTTSSGLTLRLKADLGSVEIRALPAAGSQTVKYSVHIETDASGTPAQKLLDRYMLTATVNANGVDIAGALPKRTNRAQFWVTFVVSVPAKYNLEISTDAGDIQSSDIEGHVLLQTQGGNITAGRITYRGPSGAFGDRPLAKLETQGGHIKVVDVAGDVDAFTAGGHVMVGNIAGSAKLRTGGGHIRAGNIKGVAQLETDGGNITVGEAGALVTARTGGGQIDFGEVHGSVHAQTAGGGIRVIYVAGPVEVETSGGSICMTRITNTVHAATGDGTITAWINPESQTSQRQVRLPGPSQLASGTGDIIVFLPRNLAATIDATVESGGMQRIEADPSFPLNMQVRPDGQAHALGSLNGGGALLRLRTTTGKIRLQYLDADMALHESILEEQKIRIARRLSEQSYDQVSGDLPPLPPIGEVAPEIPESKTDWQALVDRLEITFFGGMRQDPDEFKKRLLASPPPDYPRLARRAGVQGVVRLQVRLKTDGTLAVEKVLEGDPALVEAATTAIQQWRATPEQLGGKKVEVISTVTFNFQLR
jgi:TonB family protein